MQIKSISAQNYRTLEDFQLSFSSHYNAICGRNNCGKSNLIRIIRLSFGQSNRRYYRSSGEFTYKRDKTAWQPNQDSPIIATIVLELSSSNDAGLLEFISKVGKDPKAQHDTTATLTIRTTIQNDTRSISIVFNDAVLDDFSASEVHRRISQANCLVFHDSVSVDEGFYYDSRVLHGLLTRLEPDQRKKLIEKKKAFINELKRAVEVPRQALSEMIGRLNEKYEVELSVPEFEVDRFPAELSLGSKNYSVPLSDWGSGTRNRTMILQRMFEAKHAQTTAVLSDRITPIILIEEPESYLHPIAQAHFGNILQDLSDELDVQVLATTHSPYLLSTRDPTANHLLERTVTRGHQRGTKLVQTSTSNWRAPFEHALGIAGPELDLFKEAVFSHSGSLILVEGPIDKEYLELCRSTKHGDDRLSDKAEIVAYGGYSNLTNTAMTKFIKGRFPNMVVTVDLDAITKVSKSLSQVGFVQGKDLIAVGHDQGGKRCIEGLLPDHILKRAQQDHGDLVMALTSDDKEEAKKAKYELKSIYLKYFKTHATPGDDYKQLLKLVAQINSSLSRINSDTNT